MAFFLPAEALAKAGSDTGVKALAKAGSDTGVKALAKAGSVTSGKAPVYAEASVGKIFTSGSSRTPNFFSTESIMAKARFFTSWPVAPP